MCWRWRAICKGSGRSGLVGRTAPPFSSCWRRSGPDAQDADGDGAVLLVEDAIPAVRQGDLVAGLVEDEALGEVVRRVGLRRGVVGRDGVQDGVVRPHLLLGEVVGRAAVRAQVGHRGLQPVEEGVGLLLADARLLADLGDDGPATGLARDGVRRRRSRLLLHHDVRGVGHAQRNHLHWVCHTVVQLSAIILLCC